MGMPPLSISSGPAIAEGQASSTGTSTTGEFFFGGKPPDNSRAMLVGLLVLGGLIWWRTR